MENSTDHNLRLDLLDGIVIDRTIRLQDLYFFDLLK